MTHGIETEALQAQLDMAYAPGQWCCPKCKFTLLQRVISASTGAVGIKDEPGELCPNCQTPLWRVSWRQEAMEMSARAAEEILQRKDAEGGRDVALARVAALETDLDTARAEVKRLRAAIAPFESAAQMFDANGKFIGGPSGECLCSFITGKHLIEAMKARKET